MKIFLDIDEVLADFVGAAAGIWGFTPAEFTAARELGCWNIVKSLGVTEFEFWEAITAKGEQFWENLELHPWAKELHDSLQQLGDLYLLTSPSHCPTSFTGKINWIHNYFPETRYLITPYKYLLADKDSILIDDREENVEKFIKAGGWGIVFPTIGNSEYQFVDTSLEVVKEKLDLILNYNKIGLAHSL